MSESKNRDDGESNKVSIAISASRSPITQAGSISPVIAPPATRMFPPHRSTFRAFAVGDVPGVPVTAHVENKNYAIYGQVGVNITEKLARKSVEEGTSVSARLESGGRTIIKKKK